MRYPRAAAGCFYHHLLGDLCQSAVVRRHGDGPVGIVGHVVKQGAARLSVGGERAAQCPAAAGLRHGDLPDGIEQDIVAFVLHAHGKRPPGAVLVNRGRRRHDPDQVIRRTGGLRTVGCPGSGTVIGNLRAASLVEQLKVLGPGAGVPVGRRGPRGVVSPVARGTGLLALLGVLVGAVPGHPRADSRLVLDVAVNIFDGESLTGVKQ